jgi:hypothetical protein
MAMPVNTPCILTSQWLLPGELASAFRSLPGIKMDHQVLGCILDPSTQHRFAAEGRRKAKRCD